MATAVKRNRDWQPRFLEVLRATGNVSVSAQAAGIDRSWAFKTKQRNPKFADEWEDALEQAADVLEREAFRRAVQGVEEPVFNMGRIVERVEFDPLTGEETRTPVTVRKYSDTLLIFLMKGARPDKYRENRRVELTGKDGGPVLLAADRKEQVIQRVEAKVLELADRSDDAQAG